MLNSGKSWLRFFDISCRITVSLTTDAAGIAHNKIWYCKPLINDTATTNTDWLSQGNRAFITLPKTTDKESVCA
ncbi:hypothetical protein M3P05_14215 [Sansalvadorimonas sp. 2012CJ34-2]|uniref:Uncharacterized protein n=1 Tax=Parendozoicomonas callyspongiae TaxID=2942213 RepID=A0ABT0PI99_9GAMM|nr:hypothetical protein [Sansalvadorimonas sp. 2012CJ34-2]MCL6271080.1 hypothetical protein [Sansalvadorimonas sp. 2012CJ34-2]